MMLIIVATAVLVAVFIWILFGGLIRRLNLELFGGGNDWAGESREEERAEQKKAEDGDWEGYSVQVTAWDETQESEA